jgi:hypothetical protein
MFRLNMELERNYHVEDPRNPTDELVYREVEMGCYEIESNYLAFTKMKLKDELPNVCNIWVLGTPWILLMGSFLKKIQIK